MLPGKKHSSSACINLFLRANLRLVSCQLKVLNQSAIRFEAMICCVFYFLGLIFSSAFATFNGPGLLASVPYQASIQLRNKHRCSGAIISNRYVSAALALKLYSAPKDTSFSLDYHYNVVLCQNATTTSSALCAGWLKQVAQRRTLSGRFCDKARGLYIQTPKKATQLPRKCDKALRKAKPIVCAV